MHYLIIGNGAAGVTAAEIIREHDGNGRITIITAEKTPMYSRPGLAYVLSGEVPPRQIVARTLAWYETLQIELVYGRAIKLDVVQKQVLLENGRTILYDRLLVATGARAVPPPYPGADLDGVAYLDTMAGTKELMRKTRRGRRAVVIGGGITALEMVEGLTHRGMETHYFLRRDRLWHGVFNEAEASILEARMEEHGVRIHYHTDVAEILGNWRGRVRAVRLQNGEEFPCRLFGVAIGVRPQLELLQNTPIAIDRAILVNETMGTNVPDVFAAGDCAQVYDRWSQRHLLDILWPSAVAEGRAAALNMVGIHAPYRKGIPFNVCMLFGLHVTAIGQLNPHRDDAERADTVQHLSRGSSEVWFTFPRAYRNAWSAKGSHSLRLVLDGMRIVGALVVGEQSSADALRYLVEQEVDATPLLPFLKADREVLQEQIIALWERSRHQ